jgi:hypothetical protein
MLLSSLQQNWRKGQNRFCLEVRRVVGERVGQGQGENDPNNIRTYEYMNKETKTKKIKRKESRMYVVVVWVGT